MAEMVNVAEIAERLGVAAATVRRLIARQSDALGIEIHRGKGDALLLTKGDAKRLIAGYSAGRGPGKAASERPAAQATKTRAPKPKSPSRKATQPVLLTGGNPQIAKADGDAPVQAYIAAMPGWKSDVGRRLDALIVRTVPGVRKAVKWNSPMYGVADEGWFLSIHAFTKYVKVAFFRGASLRPVPPGPSKGKDTRYLDIHEHDPIDEAQLAAWVKQASALPGWKMG